MKLLAEGRHLRLVSQDGWEFIQRTAASGVVVLIATTSEGELLLVEQHRPPVGRRVIELPAGLSGDIQGEEDEALASAAARELEEETGYRPGALRQVAEGPVSAGLSDETLTFFVATDLVRIGPGGGDESEDITVHAIPLAQVPDWLTQAAARGVCIDPKVYIALHFTTDNRSAG